MCIMLVGITHNTFLLNAIYIIDDRHNVILKEYTLKEIRILFSSSKHDVGFIFIHARYHTSFAVYI